MTKTNVISVQARIVSKPTPEAAGRLTMTINGKEVALEYRRVPSLLARFVAFISGSSLQLADRDWVKIEVLEGKTGKTVLISQSAFHRALSANAGGYKETRASWLEESSEALVKQAEGSPRPVTEDVVKSTPSVPKVPLYQQAGFLEVGTFYNNAINELRLFAELADKGTPVDEEQLRPKFKRIEKEFKMLKGNFPSMVIANGRAKEFNLVFASCQAALAE